MITRQALATCRAQLDDMRALLAHHPGTLPASRLQELTAHPLPDILPPPTHSTTRLWSAHSLGMAAGGGSGDVRPIADQGSPHSTGTRRYGSSASGGDDVSLAYRVREQEERELVGAATRSLGGDTRSSTLSARCSEEVLGAAAAAAAAAEAQLGAVAARTSHARVLLDEATASEPDWIG